MLTQEQKHAIECEDKKILVRAGAGTGKTEILTRRIIHLLERDSSISIHNFAIITFTNKATENVLNRIKKFLYFQWKKEKDPTKKARYRYELETLNLAQISTIHSFCKSILEMAGPTEIEEGVFYGPGYRIDEGVLYHATNHVLNRWLAENQEQKPSILQNIPMFKFRELLIDTYRMIRRKGISIKEALEKTRVTSIFKEEGNIRVFKLDLVKLIRDLVEEHSKLKLNSLSTDDLLEYAYHVLKNRPDLVQRLQAQYRFIFVDEFQDTSMFQTEILRLLCEQGEAPPHLFVVGDIKQSIYQFRGADSQSYQRMENWIAQNGKILTLKTNFRSIKPLVVYVNQTFRRIKADEKMPAFEAEDLVAYDNSDIPVSDVVHVIRLEGMEPAERVARQIRELVDQGERCGDFAILFRTNRNMLDYEKALRRYEIPAQLIGAGDFFIRKEIVDIYRILNYILTPNDPIKKLEALETEVISHNEERLLRLIEALRPDLYRYSVAQVLEEIYKQLEIRNFYGYHKRFQAIANLDRLKEISRSTQIREQVQLVEFVDWLRRKIVTNREEQQAEIGDLNADAVKLITIHKAKGLEFPYVILTELDRDLISPGLMPEVIYSEETGIEFSIRDYVKNYYITSSNFDANRKRFMEDYLAEEARVLYVAMTRAEKRLYLVVNENLDKRRICYQNWLWY